MKGFRNKIHDRNSSNTTNKKTREKQEMSDPYKFCVSL